MYTEATNLLSHFKCMWLGMPENTQSYAKCESDSNLKNDLSYEVAFLIVVRDP